MKRIAFTLLAVVAVTGATLSSQGAAPSDVTAAVNTEDLKTELEEKVEKLGKSVESEDSFKRAMEFKTIATDAGVIACLAQAIVEHKEGGKTGIPGAAVRDAALKLAKAKTLDAAKAGLSGVQTALAGKDTGEKANDWKKLINMHRMMEEMEYREGRLRRSLRRPRRLEADASHATVLAVLGLAMRADTHEVKKEAELPDWDRMAKEYQVAVSGVAAAMKAGDADKARQLFEASNKVCADCHAQFRD